MNDMQMNNVLVTGASGFIGRRVVELLRERFGRQINVLGIGSKDVDLSNRGAVFDWAEGIHSTFECDHIIHLAALYRAGDWPVKHPATQFFSNMSINVNLLEAWMRFMPKARLTSILSYCMYPSHAEPHPESELYGTEPEDYLFAYALTKKAMLVGQRAYRQEHGLSATSVILPTVYGPGDSFEVDSHVMGALIGKFVRAADDGTKEVEVWGDGLQEREFLFVDDAVDGIFANALHSPEPVLNLGTGTAYKIGDIARWIAESAGFKGRIIFNENRFVGVSKRILDVSLAQNILGWQAKTSIREGIDRAVAWRRQNNSL